MNYSSSFFLVIVSKLPAQCPFTGLLSFLPKKPQIVFHAISFSSAAVQRNLPYLCHMSALGLKVW